MDKEELAQVKAFMCPPISDNVSTYDVTNDSQYYLQYSEADYEDAEWDPYGHAVTILHKRVMVTIVAFGLLGNIINLLILVQIGVRSPLARIEKCAYSGLVALAVSDLCFCVVVLPNCIVDFERIHYSINFALTYITYSNAFINMFILTSTWLTICMAIGHYLAICKPLWAREVMGPTMAKRSIVFVCITCVFLNIPRFWINKIGHFECDDGQKVYYLERGFLQLNFIAGAVYNWFYFSIGIAIPFLILIGSNICLIRALRNSRASHRLFRTSEQCDPNRIITLTMVIIIVLYIVLVSPAEAVHFLVQYIAIGVNDRFHLAVTIVNTMQAINFSFNFVLYFAINVSFRRCLMCMVCCRSPQCSRDISHRSSTAKNRKKKTRFFLF